MWTKRINPDLLGPFSEKAIAPSAPLLLKLKNYESQVKRSPPKNYRQRKGQSYNYSVKKIADPATNVNTLQKKVLFRNKNAIFRIYLIEKITTIKIERFKL